MPVSGREEQADGPLVLQGLAEVYVWTGEKERAMEIMEKLVCFPGYVAYGYLLRDPIWDPLRGDPRFEKNAHFARAKRNSFQVALRCSRAAASTRFR